MTFPRESRPLRVWWIRNLDDPNRTTERDTVESIKQAVEWLNGRTVRDLADDGVDSNVGGCEVLESGEWEDWDDEDGNDIDFYCYAAAEEAGLNWT